MFFSSVTISKRTEPGQMGPNIVSPIAILCPLEKLIKFIGIQFQGIAFARDCDLKRGRETCAVRDGKILESAWFLFLPSQLTSMIQNAWRLERAMILHQRLRVELTSLPRLLGLVQEIILATGDWPSHVCICENPSGQNKSFSYVGDIFTHRLQLL